MTRVHRQFSEDTLEVHGEGDLSALQQHEGVRSVQETGSSAEVQLVPGTDPQGVLEIILPTYRLRRFQIRAPTLHDIFIRLAGADSVEDGDS